MSTLRVRTASIRKLLDRIVRCDESGPYTPGIVDLFTSLPGLTGCMARNGLNLFVQPTENRFVQLHGAQGGGYTVSTWTEAAGEVQPADTVAHCPTFGNALDTVLSLARRERALSN